VYMLIFAQGIRPIFRNGNQAQDLMFNSLLTVLLFKVL
jgi:hypothetical protein